jgi:hypothetical protein
MTRNDTGHFDLTAEAFRHWDGDGEVSASCARCHSAEGFLFYVEWGVDTTKPTHPTDGFNCEMCHVLDASFATNPELKFVADVTFPSGVTIANDENDPDPSFLCMTCHQGREAKATVDQRIADVMAGKLGSNGKPLTYGFLNVHYLSAGATLYGGDAKVAYEYTEKPGKTYNKKWNHYNATPTGASQCVFCHLDDHSFLPQLRTDKQCEACHTEANGDIEKLRLVIFGGGDKDWDGDGKSAEPMKEEVEGFGNRLYTAIQAYATGIGKLISYDGGRYPYWFSDTGSSYTGWDPTLMKVTFNYQMWKKEYGTWAHNFRYVMQVLYDSIEDCGGSTAGLNRPANQ